jgi:hypothetical protein
MQPNFLHTVAGETPQGGGARSLCKSNMRPYPASGCSLVIAQYNGIHFASIITFFLAVSFFSFAANAQCQRNGAYDASEIANSMFFSTREQTKFAPGERHYPLASHATARYCFSRGCAGQLSVKWTDDEQIRLHYLRVSMVQNEDPSSELRFIKVATLQMETWLYARLRSLDTATVIGIMKRVAGHYGGSHSEDMTWVTSAMGSFDRFDKECATYAMEATQHLLVLANLGLIRHWNVTAPVYRYGIPGHWTAGLENRDTCEKYRFDLNVGASARYSLHVKGQDPALLVLENGKSYAFLFPAMDSNGIGRPTGNRDRVVPAGAFALKGPLPPVAR